MYQRGMVHPYTDKKRDQTGDAEATREQDLSVRDSQMRYAFENKYS